jgi:hypothetical protein
MQHILKFMKDNAESSCISKVGLVSKVGVISKAAAVIFE